MKVQPVIENRIAEYQKEEKHEIRFNLMAIIKDRRTTLQSRLQELEKEKSKLTQTDPMVSLLIKVPFNKKKSTFPSACLKILAMCIVNSSYYLW